MTTLNSQSAQMDAAEALAEVPVGPSDSLAEAENALSAALSPIPEAGFEEAETDSLTDVERSADVGRDDGEVDTRPITTDRRGVKRAWYWRWVDNGPAVIAILFLVTGALGLPLLYHSRAFSTRSKWIIAIANVAYTLGSCYWAYLEVMRYMAVLQNALSTM